MMKITSWFNQCCLQLTVSKTVCMFFSKGHSVDVEQDILISGERLQVVEYPTHRFKPRLQNPHKKGLSK